MFPKIKKCILEPSLLSSVVFVFLLAILFFVFVTEYNSNPASTDLSSRNFSEDIHLNKDTRVIFFFLDAMTYLKYKKIPFISKLLEEKPQNSVFHKLNVTWPTFTKQKWQAIFGGDQFYTTSSDMRNYLWSSKTDNVLGQLEANHQKVIRPPSCKQQYNLSDYHTCDNLVYDNLGKNIDNLKNRIILNHVSIVDRIGHHLKKPQHPLMDQACLNLSKYLQTVIPKLKENDYLVLAGDHGLNQYGDHGSFGKQQKSSFFFAHSPNKKLTNLFDKGEQILHSDIATTLALLYKLRIPKNSIGIPIFFPDQQTTPKQETKSMISSIYQIIFEQYAEILNFGGNTCAVDRSDINYQTLKGTRRNCILALVDVSPKKNLIQNWSIIVAVTLIITLIIMRTNIIAYLILCYLTIYFNQSWRTQHNLSNQYSTAFIIAMIMIVKGKYINKVASIGVIFIVSQFEKTQNSYFYANKWSTQQSRIIFRGFQSQIIFFTLISIIAFVYLIRRNRRLVPAQKVSKKILYILFPVVMGIQYMRIHIQQSTITSMEKKVQFIEINKLLTIVMILLITPRIYQCLKRKDYTHFFKTSKSNIQIALFCFLSIFHLSDYWIITASYCCISKLLRYQGKNLNGLISYLLAVYLWFMFGQRYQKTGHLTEQSYVYSVKYFDFLNPMSLVINIVTSILIALICELLAEQQLNNNEVMVLEEAQSNLGQGSIESERQQINNQQKVQPMQMDHQKGTKQSRLQKNILFLKQFVSMPMLLMTFFFYQLKAIQIVKNSSMISMNLYAAMIMLIGCKLATSGIMLIVCLIVQSSRKIKKQFDRI